MKQTQHNQKVVNWHRPLRSHELRSSYMRAKGTLQNYDEDLAPDQFKRGVCCHNCQYLRSWDLCNTVFIDTMCKREQLEALLARDEEEERRNNAQKIVCLLDPPLTWNLDLLRNKWLISAKHDFQSPIPLPTSLTDWATLQLANLNEPHQTRALETQLAHSLRFLMDPFASEGWKHHAVPKDSVEKLKRALGFEALRKKGQEIQEQAENCIQFLALFVGYAIRRIEDWRASSDNLEDELPKLATHLFCQYAAPSWMTGIWVFPRYVNFYEIQYNLMWAVWFICIGRGGSLSKLARLTGFAFVEKMLPYLYKAPSTFTPASAAQWALVMATCGNERVAHWMDNTDLAKVHINSVHARSDGEAFLQMWSQTIRWMAKFESFLTDDQAFQILDWAFFMHEARSLENERFSWSKRTLQSVLRDLFTFFQKCQRDAVSSKVVFWHEERFAWSVEEEDPETKEAVRWEFLELNDSILIWEEGNAMRHCASSSDYVFKCSEGSACLLSLTRNGTRAVTIEINARALVVEQVKGRFNRDAHQDELRIIELWKEAVLAPLQAAEARKSEQHFLAAA